MDRTNWIEVSLQVSPEIAEAVAEVLSRFTQEGVVIEQISEESNLAENTLLKDTLRVYGYLFADENIEEVKERLAESIWYLSRIHPLPKPTYKLIRDQDWMKPWKKQYRPLKIGKKLAVLPAWANNIFPKRIPIYINPGMAFGTGTHPTTQLCLTMMEEMVKPGQKVFDVGCGSGILSVAAIKLGAEHAYGVDINPASISSSKENAQLNKVKNSVDMVQGSVPEIIKGCFEIREAPLVIANILTSVILRLFDDGLADLIEPGGYLILSGILNTQVEEVAEKAEQCGLRRFGQHTMDDWAALGLQKAPND